MIPPLPPEALILEIDLLILRPFELEDEDLAIALWCGPDLMRYVDAPDTPQIVRDTLPNVIRWGQGAASGRGASVSARPDKKSARCFCGPCQWMPARWNGR